MVSIVSYHALFVQLCSYDIPTSFMGNKLVAISRDVESWTRLAFTCQSHIYYSKATHCDVAKVQ